MLYNEPIFLEPVYKERIWGGQKLKTAYDYDIPFDKTGEAWVVSAHSHGSSVIRNGPLRGKSLADAWESHGELFNKKSNNNAEYPLLIKILDATDDLSVQVHPNDQFARHVEGVPFGKTECWYVLSAEPGAELVLGHQARTIEEVEHMMDNDEWGDLLQKVPVKAGDFFHVPSGTIHAIGKGIVMLETQQSSDITYRVYDYDRIDVNGDKRELYLERAKQVITVPHQTITVAPSEVAIGDLTQVTLIEEQYFSVYHWQLNGKAIQNLDKDFLQVTVISGNAVITVDQKSFNIKYGTAFILPYGIESYELSGDAAFVVSSI